MARALAGKVAVVTGASSGIGRATALRFAREGADVVVAARAAGPLRDVVAACEAQGVRAKHIEVDVADEDAVERLALVAAESFGRIDVWVNDAAVLALSRFDDMPTEVFHKVIETNLLGTVNGARAALRRFRAQGAGVLVNVASLEARITIPYSTAYAASKHAVLGFSNALRQELQLAKERGIHVCVVLPATIDTPIFQHAANFSGREVRAMPPIYPAEKVAKAIVALARRPRREVLVGTSAHLFSAAWRVAPGLTEKVIARMADRTHLSREPSRADSPGNAFGPTKPEAVSGGWQAPPRSLTGRLLLAAAPAALAAVWAARRYA